MMRLKNVYFLLFLVSLFAGNDLQAQRNKIDSLLQLLPQKKDSGRIKVILNLANSYRRVSLDSAIYYASQALEESRRIKHLKYEFNAVYKLGDYYRELGDFNSSLKYLDLSLKMAEGMHDSVSIAKTNNSLGNTYQRMGDFPMALAAFQRSLQIKEKFRDKNGMANTYVNIGNLYDRMSIYDKAEEYFLKGVKLKKELGDRDDVAAVLNNLAIIYTRTRRVKKSIETLEWILKDYSTGIEPYLKSAVLGNLAEAYQSEGKPKKAITAAKECLAIRERMGDSTQISYMLITIAGIEIENKDYADGIKHATRALQMGTRLGLLNHVWDANVLLAEAYATKGDHKLSVKHYRDVVSLYDTLINSRAHTVIHEMEAKYESEKKEAEISKLNSQKKIHELELDRQEANISRQRWIMIFGALLIGCMIAFSFVVFRGYKQKKRSNEKLQSAYNTIEDKQKEILDSIHYARRIQNSLLPSEKYIHRILKKEQN